ncbi:MAG TPA: 1-(5-phosphoribosyl)-5-[(5-phosphoribosylamino)methylideneamino]imidazole-4-carboxamide isomerase, partial [bacterium]|nr:1-(5-phosphoribosyl)-5-[(5-phosphoribosylamino)methylideneamino]imidazole-4-carboxamide isomerase [bacterium]
MIVYPAVDIKGGRCVRLYQGRPDRETVYEDDPLAAAARWAAAGASWLHVVDLDGAFAGFPVNHRLIGNIAAASGVRVQAGGGVRKMETIETLLEAGISRVIVGSRAVRDPDFAQAAVREFGKRVIPSIDSRDGEVLLQGWSERAGAGAETVGIEFRKMGYASTVLTDVSGDGTLAGPDLPGIERFLEATGLKVIAAGGVSSLEDIRNLKCLESKGLEGVITGKAIYDG